MVHYSLLQFSKWLDCPIEQETPVSGVCVDSRLLQPGHLFFALKGACTDGHLFLKEAAQKKASAAVVSKDYPHEIENLPLIRVENALHSLQLLTQKLIAQRQQKIVAVTGSVGKTTTKDFIAGLLSQKYKVGSTPGNSNSQIGIPLALFNHTTGDEDLLVLEMGMTHAGQLAKLVQMAPPEVAVITKTALVHACNFNSLEDIGRAKAEIFSHPKLKLGILDRYCVNYKEIKAQGGCPKFSFAVDSHEADYTLKVQGKQMILSVPDSEETMDLLALPGVHNLHNYLAAIAVARSFHLNWEEIRLATLSLKLPERRLQQVEKMGALFVNDSYNASPESVKAALKSLPQPKPGGKRIAVLGEMLELGQFSKGCHREIGEYALKYLDHLFCYGKECFVLKECWEKAGKPVVWGMERAEILDKFRDVLSEGDIVLLKGSRSKEVWKVLDEL